MRLTNTTHSLELITSAAGSIAWHAVFNNLTATDSAALDGQGNITTATTTTLVAAPAASEQRDILNLAIRNAAAASNDVTVQKNVSGTLYPIFKATLAAGEMLEFSPNLGFSVLDAQGRVKTVTPDAPPLVGRTSLMLKTGATATEAAGVRYAPWKDAGSPGVFTVGTPGLAGHHAASATGPAAAHAAGHAPAPAPFRTRHRTRRLVPNDHAHDYDSQTRTNSPEGAR